MTTYQIKIFCGYYEDHYKSGVVTKNFNTYEEAREFNKILYNILLQKSNQIKDFIEDNFGIYIVTDTIQVLGIYKIVEEKIL